MRHLTIPGMLAVAALALGAAGCGSGDDTAKARAAAEGAALILGPNDVARADSADLVRGIPVSGTLRPGVDVHIAAPISELLDQVLVREGQAVRQGQVLARFRITALAPAATGAEAQERVAAADHERMKNLLGDGAISEREMEGAEAAYRAAQAQLALARKRLEEGTVRAPVSGTIAKRWVQSGDRVGDGDLLFRLVRTTELEFEATMAPDAAGEVKVGAPVLLTVSGASEAREGRIARINPTADASTRQVRVYAIVDNRDGRLVGDLFATGRVVLARAPRALAVPRTAVRRDADGPPYAWVVTAGRAEKRAIATGIVDDARDLVQVTSGLRQGEGVIVAPAEGLAAGKPVQVARDSAAAAPRAGRGS